MDIKQAVVQEVFKKKPQKCFKRKGTKVKSNISKVFLWRSLRCTVWKNEKFPLIEKYFINAGVMYGY